MIDGPVASFVAGPAVVAASASPAEVVAAQRPTPAILYRREKGAKIEKPNMGRRVDVAEHPEPGKSVAQDECTTTATHLICTQFIAC